MRRSLEYLLYAAAILFFIVRYANVDVESPRRAAPKPPPGPSVRLPDYAGLPRDISSTVVVDIEQKRQASVGTAFAVDNEGTYVSARHVIQDCDAIALIRDRQAIPTQLQAVANNRDFAILKTDQVRVRPFELTTEAPTRGDDGFMMGYPQGVPADVRATVIGETVMKSRGRYNTRERVIAWVERERRPRFSGSLGGISGGPVLDADGRIVGTVVAGAPRRGRVYTTNPQVFAEAALVATASETARKDNISNTNFDEIADEYRSRLRIAQVYCSVE